MEKMKKSKQTKRSETERRASLEGTDYLVSELYVQMIVGIRGITIVWVVVLELFLKVRLIYISS